MDTVFNIIEPFGRYQKCFLIIAGNIAMLSAMTIYSTIFKAAAPELICKPKLANSTLQFSTVSSEPQAVCDIWHKLNANESYADLYECQFDKKYYGSTIITEWGLVCEKNFLAGLTQTFYMIGAFACLFVGYFSDRFGRKKTLTCVSAFLSFFLIVSEVLQLNVFKFSMLTRYVIYSVSQFFIGICGNSIYSITYIILIEITSTKYSTIVSNVYLYLYVLGELVILVVAYFMRDWHNINWFTAGYSLFVLVTVILLVPESPRFLIHRKKYKEAFEVFQKIGRFNRKNIQPLEEDPSVQALLNKKEILEEDQMMFGDSPTDLKAKRDHKDHSNIIKYMLESRDNFYRTLLLIYVWFSMSLVYYGVSLGI